MSAPAYLISCDWGTSSFRLYLVQASDGSILQEVREGLGIKELMTQWQKSGTPDRLAFFLQYLEFRIYLLSKKGEIVLDELPVFISGMASSSIGMLELPYAQLPFALDGSDLLIRQLQHDSAPKRAYFLLSGLRSQSDVMRGEESQLIGLAGHFQKKSAVAILPGTHSKHVYVEAGRIVNFRTYMTGEFFAILCQHSILQSSLAAAEAGAPFDEASFTKGVQAALQDNLLSASFHVRTNELLHQWNAQSNFNYLSGLLIGCELRDLPAGESVYLCGGGRLQRPYALALALIGRQEYQVLDAAAVDAAVARAHARTYATVMGN